MSEAELIITIGPDGSTVVQVQGVSGPGCLALTAALEAALGQVAERQRSIEYYAVDEGQEVRQWNS